MVLLSGAVLPKEYCLYLRLLLLFRFVGLTTYIERFQSLPTLIFVTKRMICYGFQIASICDMQEVLILQYSIK
jgi:hypothetical protein